MGDITEIVLLYCGRAVKPEARLSEVTRNRDGGHVRNVMLACGNKVETLALLKLIQGGTDGILVVCCPNECCQFVTGSLHAAGRVSHARQLLDEIGLEPERIRFLARNELGAADIDALVAAHAETVKRLDGAVV